MKVKAVSSRFQNVLKLPIGDKFWRTRWFARSETAENIFSVFLLIDDVPGKFMLVDLLMR
jgi:hypothetical protein